MLPRGVLEFQYEADRSSGGLTSLAGLALYLDLIEAIGLGAVIRQNVRVAGPRGWLDIQMVLALILLNLAGGDGVADLERLATDRGFAAVLRAIERAVRSSSGRRLLRKRWWRSGERTVPSPSAASAWLARLHAPSRRKPSPPSRSSRRKRSNRRGLWPVDQALPGGIQTHQPTALATLDMDATLVETHKRDALHGYKGFQACQPLNCFCSEPGPILYSEFRDGNVSAGHEQRWVLQASLAHLPTSVTMVLLRSDTAGYQAELLLYGGEWKDPRFGAIDAHNLNTAMKRLVLGGGGRRSG